MDWTDILGFLETRRGLLDGVVFSGGEPTLQRGLGAAIADIRAMGYRIGLHSGGPYPQRLAAILPMVDWVGFDIKAASTDYDRITRVSGSGLKARKSLELLLESGVDYELRTTVDPSLLDNKAIAMIRAELAAYGTVSHKLQQCRPIDIRTP